MKNNWKRFGAVVLSAAIAFTFMPFLGGQEAYSANGGAEDAAISVDAPAEMSLLDTDNVREIAADFGIGEDKVLEAAENAGIKVVEAGVAVPVDGDAGFEDDADIPEAEAEPDADLSAQSADEPPVSVMYSNSQLSAEDLSAQGYPTGTINVTLNKETGQATVTGTIDGGEFDDLYVDDSYVYYIDGTSFSYTLNMKDYYIGYHDVYATVKGFGRDEYVIAYEYAVPTYVYTTPANSLSCYTTGKNYLTHGSNVIYDQGYDAAFYLEYRKGKGKWSKPYGPFDDTKKVTGLKPNTKYTTRGYYGKQFTYGGKSYFFSGKDTNHISKTVTLKTAMAKKPPVKSIKTSKVQYKSYTSSWTLWIGGIPYTRYYTTWYTYFRATVNMKKKPGTAGIYIGGVRKGGNKKKYSGNYYISGQKKVKKVKFVIQSYQSKIYGGISPAYKKSVKLKK